MILFRSLFNLIFPPKCRFCKERSEALFCSDCFEFLIPLDPLTRCRHCFAEVNSAYRLCQNCISSPSLSIPKAFLFEESLFTKQLYRMLLQEKEEALVRIIASFLIILWERLDWPMPDDLIFIPRKENPSLARSIAKEITEMLSCSFREVFYFDWEAPFQWNLKRKGEVSLKRKCLLLFDLGGDIDWLRRAISQLRKTQPQAMYLLSVFEEVHTPVEEERDKGKHQIF